MALFDELNFNAGIDPTLLSQGGRTMGFSLGSSISPDALGGGATAFAQPTGPGNFFSNLFGDGDGMFSRQSLLGGTNQQTGVTTQGILPIALGGLQAIMGAVQGRKAMGLAEDQFKESKRQFDLNFNTQRKTVNTELEDRQRARVASNPTAYQGVDEYMKKNAV